MRLEKARKANGPFEAMTILLDFRPVARYLQKYRMTKFRAKILPICRPYGPQYALEGSTKTGVSFSR